MHYTTKFWGTKIEKNNGNQPGAGIDSSALSCDTYQLSSLSIFRAVRIFNSPLRVHKYGNKISRFDISRQILTRPMFEISRVFPVRVLRIF